MIGKIDNQVLEKFKVFQEHEKGEAYRDLELGSVEFEKVVLSDEEYFKLTMGQSPDGNALNKNANGIPFFQGKTDFGKIYLENPTTWTTKSKKEAKKEDILISLRAPAGVVNIANIDLSIGRGLASIRCLKNTEKLYVFCFLQNNEAKINVENDKGGFFTSMTRNYLDNLEVPLPKLQENFTSYDIQKAIVEFLEFWKVEYTEVYREKIGKMKPMLETMKQNLISSTFALDSKIAESFNDFAKDEGFDVKLEEIEFEDKELKDIAQKINAGATPSRKDSTLWTNLDDADGIPWLDIDRKEFEQYKIRTYREKITKKGLKASSTWIVPKNSIMITIGGSLGFIATNEFDTCTNQNILNVILDENYSSNFVIHVLDNFYKYNVRNNPNGYGNLSKTSEEQRKVQIPIKTIQYNSLDLQNLLVSYWEMVLGNFEKREKLFDRALELCDKIDEAFLYRTFSKIQWSK